MFDVCTIYSIKAIKQWIRHINKLCKEIPIVICGNKIDSNEIRVNVVARTLQNCNYPFIDISGKSHYNYKEPFQVLLRIITNQPDLELTLNENDLIKPTISQDNLNIINWSEKFEEFRLLAEEDEF